MMDYHIFYLWAIINLLVMCSESFKVGYGPPFFDKEPRPTPVDKDYIDLRSYTPLELEAIKELKEKPKSRSFIDEIKMPKCIFKKWKRGRCCLSFILLGKKKKICLKAAIRLKRKQSYFALTLNRVPLFQHEITLTEYCAGLPFLNKISVCLHFYYLKIRFNPNFRIKVCAQLTIATIFSLHFNCIIIENGEVKFDHSLDSGNEGAFVLSYKDGKLLFEFNVPIPAAFKRAIKNIAEVVKQKVVVFVSQAVDAAEKIWDGIKEFFSWSC